MVPALVELALEYYRTPVAYSHVADASRPLPRGFSELLTEFGAALTTARIEQTARLLATDSRELEAAARFFARHVLLNPAGDYYRFLGLCRDAGPESIRSHYLLLIRLFHPDRAQHANDADLACSSKLNAAYQVLHDPAQRARYDRRLPRSAGRGSRGDPRAFFQPWLIPAAEPEPSAPERLHAILPPWLGPALLIGLALLGVGYLLTGPHVQPTLRLARQDLAGNGQPLPHYLAGPDAAAAGATPAAASSAPDPARTPAPDPVPNTAAVVREDVGGVEDARANSARAGRGDGRKGAPSATSLGDPPTVRGHRGPDRNRAADWRASARSAGSRGPQHPDQDPPAPGDTAPVLIGTRLVLRLERAYRQGDADAVAALFTDSARTSDGTGRVRIRAQYARLFRDIDEQQLVITGMTWQAIADSRVRGSGRFSVRIKERASGTWRRTDGRIAIELVPAGSVFRIAEMMYGPD